MDYSALRHKAYDERMGLDTYGVEKAKIEAGIEINYLEHLLARKEKGSEISENGQKHLKAIDDKFIDKVIPGYSKMNEKEREPYAEQVQKIPVYSKMSTKERQEREEEIKEIFVSSPHDGRPGVELPARGALKSGELYFYEHGAKKQ